MSYDFDTIPSNCDHRQIMERMVIDPGDLKTLIHLKSGLRMRAPINGQSTLVMRINGKVVPKNHLKLGWEILVDETSIAPDRRSKIVFNNQVRLFDALIELEYATSRPFCRKCNGRGVVADFIKSPSGSFKPVKDTRKLVQKVLKFILTSKCVFYPSYTCRIKDFIGRKFGTAALGVDDISFEITNSLSRLKDVQSAQAAVQQLSPREILRDLGDISVQRDENDPTVVNTQLEVLTYGNDNSMVNFGIKVT